MHQTLRTALLVYPPTGAYDRFERCQAPIASESVTILRPPLDLAYLAAVLERRGINVHLRDYPAEGKNWEDVQRDIKDMAPDLLLVSATLHTVDEDCRAFKLAKELDSSIVCVLKGFFPDQGRRIMAARPEVDLILREEAEYALDEFAGGRPRQDIPGLSWRMSGQVQINEDMRFPPPLDSLPFPARHLLKNGLYRMPDNGRKMGIVLLGKGCPRGCSFCLVPLVNKKQVRLRGPDSLVAELRECVQRHGIADFWFRADNFTADRSWVLQICRKITEERLSIRWATNSRVDSLDEEVISAMKAAGCFAIGLGVESGSEETLLKIGKSITKQQAENAVELCRRHGLQTYLFFIIGFPWETCQHIEDTIAFAKKLEGDLVNFSFAIPYPGTELFELSTKLGQISADAGYSYGNYGTPLTGTLHLRREELVGLEKSAYRQIVFSPAYIMRHLRRIRSMKQLIFYFKAACHLIRLSV